MIKINYFALIIIISFIIFTSNAQAKYDPVSTSNNIYGIHITNHSDMEEAARLLNTSGGDWGYVTVVITEDQRDKKVWQDFFDQARKLHLIPIIRVASKVENGIWIKPKIEEITNWINFFNSLNWVIENRYVIIGNEPNHAKEWGGIIDPNGYGTYLKAFSIQLKDSNPDYFILPAGLDQAAGNTKDTMDLELFIKNMVSSIPDVFQNIDGWNSHSYPNPDFSADVDKKGRNSIIGYQWELDYLKELGINNDYPVFITETGWSNKRLNEEEVSNNFNKAYTEIWNKDSRVVAVTPFILNYQQDPFSEFSWKKDNENYFKQYEVIQKIEKIKGMPRQLVDGKILFSYLRSTSEASSKVNGYLLIQNNGQGIWNNSNTYLLSENSDMVSISETKMFEVLPFQKQFIGYSINYPNIDGESELKLGLYVEQQKIGDVYDGKIYSFISGDSIIENISIRLKALFINIENLQS